MDFGFLTSKISISSWAGHPKDYRVMDRAGGRSVFFAFQVTARSRLPQGRGEKPRSKKSSFETSTEFGEDPFLLVLKVV